MQKSRFASIEMDFNMSIRDYFAKLKADGYFKNRGKFICPFMCDSFFIRNKIVKVWDLLAISEENVRSHVGFNEIAVETVITIIKELKELHAKKDTDKEAPPTLEDVQIKLERSQAELARSRAFCRELEEAAAELQKEKEKNTKRIRELESQGEEKKNKKRIRELESQVEIYQKSAGLGDIQGCKTAWRKLYFPLAKILHPDKNMGYRGQDNRQEGFKAAASLNDYFNEV
jgi:hypothetical protein